MATSMMEKFQKYWSDFNLTLAIAVVFDPRYKLHFIEWSYKKVYGENNNKFRKVDKLLDSTFQEYVNVHDGSSTTSNFASSSNASKFVEKTSDDTRRFYEVKSKLLDFDDFESTKFVTNKKSELKLYLEEPRMERTMELDVLAFWRANQFRYPILARMARDFLTIPISTVASVYI
ncbi:AC transposase [Artemisia annua]|uniref:AC transposase n=1 Tax=Artemisia annua TaxID=35608 RepID=A0A2U1MEL7_ARTAN|nr:AC transposase [Artemisia annua]